MHGQETTKNLNPTINILFKVYRLILDYIPYYMLCMQLYSGMAKGWPSKPS